MPDFYPVATHFQESLLFCRRAGCRPELAWTCRDYADTLLDRSEPGDLERAMSLLEESLAISTEFGMGPLMEGGQNRLESLRSLTNAEPAYPDELTQREVEVLRLITQGKSNREIGVELVITESTMQRHVSNIYDKISVSKRAEVTHYALGNGLVRED